MLIESVAGEADFVTVLALVAGSVVQVSQLYVILERCEATAVLCHAALHAPVGPPAQPGDPLPDHVAD